MVQRYKGRKDVGHCTKLTFIMSVPRYAVSQHLHPMQARILRLGLALSGEIDAASGVQALAGEDSVGYRGIDHSYASEGTGLHLANPEGSSNSGQSTSIPYRQARSHI